jgi:hypothetical protein
LDLRTDANRALLGLSEAIFTCHDRMVTHAWSLAIFGHPARVDGILYPADHDPRRSAIAIFDRAEDAIVPDNTCPWIKHPELESVLAHYELPAAAELL